MSVEWYVLRSKPNKENFLWGQVQAHHLESFYPAIRAKAVSPHARKMKPYFPGHLFVHVDLGKVPDSFWLWLPGSRGLVFLYDIPAVVPNGLIDLIRRNVEEINSGSSVHPAGTVLADLLKIKSYPFTEYDAIFDSCKSGSDRVRVLLQHLRDRLNPALLPAG